MANYEVTLIALDIRRWDLDSQRINLTTYFVMDDEEKTYQFDLSIIQPPEMIEEFLGKIRNGCEIKMKNSKKDISDIQITMSNETFLRQKLYNYFKRILMELNNPKRKKGQPKMIFTTHMDLYNENQDVSFLPQIIQFYVVLNWARKYYEKEDFQRAVDPLRKLIKVKPDFGLGYKWLARSLKKIRKYDDAMKYYEQYAEVDDTLDAWLDLAKSYRKGKIFDKSEEIYHRILADNETDKEARIGLCQIKYARNDPEFMQTLDELYEEDPEWLRTWLKEEFNFRIYTSPKTPLSPILTARYLGYDKVFELTQRAFRNEIPSHFNPNRARMSFYKEELDQWALVMNRFKGFKEDITLYPDKISLNSVDMENELDLANEPETRDEGQAAIPQKRSTKVEEILTKIRASRAARQRSEAAFSDNHQNISDSVDISEQTENDSITKKPVIKRKGKAKKNNKFNELNDELQQITVGRENDAVNKNLPGTASQDQGELTKESPQAGKTKASKSNMIKSKDVRKMTKFDDEKPQKKRGRPKKKVAPSDV